MSIEFEPDENSRFVAAQTAAFVQSVAIPAEALHRGMLHHGPEDLRRDLQEAAREAGVFAPHVPQQWGGLGLDMRGQSLVFEEAGYSLFGPLAINAAAPDEGNIHLLQKVATESQQDKYLGPLARGEIRSCFAMTEPSPGAGSDPNLLATVGSPIKSRWCIDGRKWFITGARGADLIICMARTSGRPGGVNGNGATMFLIDANNPGVRVTRDIESLDQGMFGGHCEVVFDGCIVGPEAVLGQVDCGFQYAQIRLDPARLTHCMRWLGLARRAHELALERSSDREIFGARLAELGMVQQMLADSEIDLAASRGLIWHAAWKLDGGQRAAHETSIAKTFVSEAVGRILDRSMQICGALGMSGDLPLSRFFREVRPFRIYDGPSETHHWAIARRAVRRYVSSNAS
jgi:acyl-CoA dehydrogenase